MDHRIVFAAVYLLFLVRDTRLIADRPRLFWGYAPILFITTVACAMTAESLSYDEVLGLAKNSRFLIFGVLIHGIQAARSFQRCRRGENPGWRAFAPGPMLCVTFISTSHFALAQIDGSTGLAVGLGLGAAYGALLGLLFPARGWVQTLMPANPLRFVAFSHFASMLLVAVLALPEVPVGRQAVDWMITGLVLGAVALLFGASFAWHRLRQG